MDLLSITDRPSESQRSRHREIETIQNQSSAHQHNLTKELQEQEELHEAIDELNSRRDSHLSRRDELKVQISEIQKAINIRKQAQQQHRRYLDGQAMHNRPELQFWESSLCLRIDGTGVEDHLRFVFTHLDERRWERECWFELSMGNKDYEVIRTEPVLEGDQTRPVLDRLNETRDLAMFLKGMRGLFGESLRT